VLILFRLFAAAGFSYGVDRDDSRSRARGYSPRFTYRARFLVRVRTPSASGFDPAAPAPGYRVDLRHDRSKPLAEGHSGVCALRHFWLSDRWPCGRRTARGKVWTPVRDDDFAAALTF
jgi:hypothetical protein